MKYSKTCVKGPLSKKRLMQVKSIAECSFCNTFDLIKLTFVIKIFVLSIFERPFYTGFTVVLNDCTPKLCTLL